VVVIFGWGEGQAKDLGEVAPATCPNCRNSVFMHHIRTEKRMSLYFIPLVPYGSNEYLACPICKQGLELRPEQRGAVNEMRSATRVFRRGGVDEGYYLGSVAQFWRRIGMSPAGRQVVQPPGSIPTGPPAAPASPAAPARATAPGASLAEQLAGLGELHASGVLTDDEFEGAKRRLLGG
jgi:uncharacterized protein YbaR (Trm112 family)